MRPDLRKRGSLVSLKEFEAILNPYSLQTITNRLERLGIVESKPEIYLEAR
jgi:hypothetical protein